MPEAVIVEAARTPVGRRRGALSGLHPAELLGTAQKACWTAPESPPTRWTR